MANSTTQTPPTGQSVAGSALFKKFLGAAEGYLKQPNRLKPLLTDAYRKAAQKNEVGHLAGEAWHALQGLFRLIRTSVSGEYHGVPGTTIAAAVAVLIYFLSPIDLIPDFIPVAGLLDDVALLAWFSTSIKHELDKFYEWESAKAATLADPAQFSATNGADRYRTNQSAKHTAVAALPSAAAYPAGQSATDAGLGAPGTPRPEPTTEPVRDAGPDGPLPEPENEPQTFADDVALTTDGSRDGNRGSGAGGDPGANNR